MNCPLCSADEKRGVYQCPQCKRDIAEDLRAALLQVEALKKDVLYHSEAGIEAEREKKAANLQNERLQNALREIVKLHAESNARDYSPGMARVAEAALAEKPKGERARCQVTMASDFVCGEYLPCKVHPDLKRKDECGCGGKPSCNLCGDPVTLHRRGRLQPIRCLCGHSWNHHIEWLDEMESSCKDVKFKGDGCTCTLFDQA